MKIGQIPLEEKKKGRGRLYINDNLKIKTT